MLYSHPDKLLIKHLEEVANNCKNLIEGRTLFVKSEEKKQICQDLAFIMGAFHDLGKATSYFQIYLESRGENVVGPKSHALISALFVKEMSKIYLAKTSLSDFEQQLFAHFTFTAVKRHHGNLDDFEAEMYIEPKHTELQEQIKVFDESGIENIIEYFNTALKLDYGFQDFKKYILSKAYLKDMPKFYDNNIAFGEFEELPISTKIEYFYFHQLLFGGLLLSDKRDVILEEERNTVKPVIDDNIVTTFRENRDYNSPKSELDRQKNKAYQSSLDNLDNVFSKENHLYSITLPTGLGKTITSFAVAWKMRKILNLPNQRLIITIPFTSIIDQNFQVYEEILATRDTNILLKHHHLSEPLYKINDEEFNPDKSQFLIETWQSEVVVTTFVQLLNSIFSNDKSLLMKLPNIANAIVILDEIQTVSYEYWQLIKNVFEVLGEMYNCYFILMSATQPLIFLPQKEIIEIVPNYEEYFQFFNRTKLINRAKTKISLDDFSQEVLDYHENNPQKDILVILNTKKHSKKLFENIRETIDLETVDIYYLSTLITPFERKEIIKRIKQDSTKPKIVISTQLIEAGVDISVDTVFRAIAPIDSIIQAAGRSNRYDEKAYRGEVYLYDIKEMDKANGMIYGAALLLKTQNVLKNIDEVEENGYLNLIKNYFIEIRKQSDSRLSEYLENIAKLEFAKLGQFSLIEESKTESVFLQLNPKAVEVWNQFDEIYSNESLDSRSKKQAFSKIKSTFYDYVINVQIPRDKKSIVFDDDSKPHGFYLSTLENPTSCYNYDSEDFTKNTGYQEVNLLSY